MKGQGMGEEVEGVVVVVVVLEGRVEGGNDGLGVVAFQGFESQFEVQGFAFVARHGEEKERERENGGSHFLCEGSVFFKRGHF